MRDNISEHQNNVTGLPSNAGRVLFTQHTIRATNSQTQRANHSLLTLYESSMRLESDK